MGRCYDATTTEASFSSVPSSSPLLIATYQPSFVVKTDTLSHPMMHTTVSPVPLFLTVYIRTKSIFQYSSFPHSYYHYSSSFNWYDYLQWWYNNLIAICKCMILFFACFCCSLSSWWHYTLIYFCGRIWWSKMMWKLMLIKNFKRRIRCTISN